MGHNLKKPLIILLLVLVTLWVFWKVTSYDFVTFDDEVYVTENHQVQAGLTGEGLKWAFTTTHANFWHPLTWLSHMLDCHLFGLNPGGHHLTNLLLHITNTVLLFLVFHQMTGALWRSFLVAALFACHPLHVESVAWISERKDVLSTFFWMLTLGIYLRYAERPHTITYLLLLSVFTLGLMAKPMLVSLPFVLLLLDYWPLGRFKIGRSTHTDTSPFEKSRRIKHSPLYLILEKTPLMIFSAVFCVVAYMAQAGGSNPENIPAAIAAAEEAATKS